MTIEAVNLQLGHVLAVGERDRLRRCGAGIVAAQANLAPRLVSLMVGAAIPLGLVTASGWHSVFGWLAD